MLAWLIKNRARRRTARSLYGSIVTAARRPGFYADWGVPDTVQGRFELILLHLVLLQHRLGAEGQPGARLAQALSETFVVDMDDGMREMTFGDLAVPREVKRAAAALFDRYRAYLAALAGADDTLLQDALRSQMAYLDDSGNVDVPRLSAYAREACRALDGQAAARILGGEVVWPDLPAAASPGNP
jgi:cytochrome b pre-mRNA-processing protein 3